MCARLRGQLFLERRTITICTATATGTPCFPTATIYTDPLLTVVSVNPITADGNGNYNFYAPAGTYVRSITGQGLPGRTDVITIPCVPSSLGCTGASLLGADQFMDRQQYIPEWYLERFGSPLPVPAGQGPFTIGDCVNVKSIAPLVSWGFWRGLQQRWWWWWSIRDTLDMEPILRRP